MFAEDGFTRRDTGQEFVGNSFGDLIPEEGGKGVHKSVRKI